ncbi:putative conidiation protein con-6-like protein [Eutypa lata UCREL1]|uniref:Putative conidiation protein con-6-like protein n=1 Tax=Eutypa lata (strain UCR-EL1) TaxID=1287681 RepID=M7SJF3_EUTLA|nr:putative conidiation protein con-6-like protein [Eutypa lata UCREL1]
MDSAGVKSTMSRDIEELTTGKEQISKSVQGHKANLFNLNTSEKSKENSREAIEAMGGEAAHYGNIEQPRSKDAADKLEGSRAMATE